MVEASYKKILSAIVVICFVLIVLKIVFPHVFKGGETEYNYMHLDYRE